MTQPPEDPTAQSATPELPAEQASVSSPAAAPGTQAPARNVSHWRAGVQRSWPMMLLSGLLMAGIIQMTFFIGQILWRSADWALQTRASQTRAALIEEEINVIKDGLKAQQDPRYLESRARCLGFVKEGEKVVIALPSPEEPDNQEATGTAPGATAEQASASEPPPPGALFGTCVKAQGRPAPGLSRSQPAQSQPAQSQPAQSQPAQGQPAPATP